MYILWYYNERKWFSLMNQIRATFFIRASWVHKWWDNQSGIKFMHSRCTIHILIQPKILNFGLVLTTNVVKKVSNSRHLIFWMIFFSVEWLKNGFKKVRSEFRNCFPSILLFNCPLILQILKIIFWYLIWRLISIKFSNIHNPLKEIFCLFLNNN